MLVVVLPAVAVAKASISSFTIEFDVAAFATIVNRYTSLKASKIQDKI